MKDLAMNSLTQAIEDEKKEQWRVEGRSMLFDAKKVNTRDVTRCAETSRRVSSTGL